LSHTTRRKTLLTLGAGMAALALPSFAQDKWPTKPIRLMVGFPPGGGADAMARVIAKKLEDQLGQPVVVENKNGATGTICSTYVAQAAPDGYVLQLSHISSNVLGPLLLSKGKLDPAKDFTPIGLLGITPHVLAVNPAKVKFNTVPELIAYAKANPGKLTFMSAGNGSAPHLAGEAFKSMAGVDLMHVPFKGTGEAMTSLLAGEVDMTFSTTGSTLAHVTAGKLRALAVTAPTRIERLPNVPTIAETLKGYEAYTWYGVNGPAKLPVHVVKRMEAAIAAVLKQPDIIKRMDELDADVRPGNAAEFTAFWHAEVTKYQKLMATANIKLS
jgi:tripartite-type tricarboxylate transporter receptor subunit TctC